MKKLFELCFGKEPSEKELSLLEIQLKRLIENGYDNKTAMSILLKNKLNTNDLEFEDSIIKTTKDSIYYHYELQVHSKPGYYDPEKDIIIKEPYFLEMKRRYTMDQLLDYYYDKILVPIHFREYKRDIGAFNHLISCYKFSSINTVDFILFLIDHVSCNKYKVNNPLDLKNWAQEVYEYLESHVTCIKLDVRYREENLINE